MKIKGTLTLIPTPISESGELEPVAFRTLLHAATDEIEKNNSVFAIEDLKPGRKRWLQFKLPRETVDHFFLYNEHTAKTAAPALLDQLLAGKNVYLMSDGGLPAFYDPGVELVALCHQNKIKVTATPFSNSVVLAIALSGFSHKKFWFEGFLPLEETERRAALKNCIQQNITVVMMDTPYRLKRLLEEFQELGIKEKRIFLAMDLNSENEELLLGTPSGLLSQIKEFKREFVLLLSH